LTQPLPSWKPACHFRYPYPATDGDRRLMGVSLPGGPGKRVPHQDRPDKVAVSRGKSLSCVRTPLIEGVMAHDKFESCR